jgi:MarR family transcriptional regulator for hemolysin
MDVLTTPGHLISLAARGFARLSEARLKPLGFGVGHLPVLVEVLEGFTDAEADQLANLLQRVIANLDRIASA